MRARPGQAPARATLKSPSSVRGWGIPIVALDRLPSVASRAFAEPVALEVVPFAQGIVCIGGSNQVVEQ